MRLRVVIKPGWNGPDVYDANTGAKLLNVRQVRVVADRDGIRAYVVLTDRIFADGTPVLDEMQNEPIEVEFAQPTRVISVEQASVEEWQAVS